eukprot:486158-Amphidinium_carterae.1
MASPICSRLFAVSAVEIYLQYHAQETLPDGYGTIHVMEDCVPRRRLPKFDDEPPTRVTRTRITHKRPLSRQEHLSLVPGGSWDVHGHRVHRHWSKSGKLRYKCFDCGLSAVPRYKGIWAQNACFQKGRVKKIHASKGKPKLSQSRRLEKELVARVPHIHFDRAQWELWIVCRCCGVRKRARPVSFVRTFVDAHESCG